MNIKVKDYLVDLSQENLPRDNGILVANNETIKKVDSSSIFSSNVVSRYMIGDKSFFVKPQRSMEVDNIGTNAEIITSKVYNDLNVNCAEYYPIILSSSSSFIEEMMGITQKSLGTISQDLCMLEGLDIISADKTNILDILHDCCPNSCKDSDYWTILKAKEYLVDNIMTKECFDEMVNMYLLDIPMTQRDRTAGNFFLAKKKGENLWSSVIAIDNSFTLQNFQYALNYYSLHNGIHPKEIVDKILSIQADVQTLQGVKNTQSFDNRLSEINYLIASGKLSDSQISLLKRIKNYDISSAINITEKDKNICVSTFQKDIMRYVWQHVQDELEV